MILSFEIHLGPAPSLTSVTSDVLCRSDLSTISLISSNMKQRQQRLDKLKLKAGLFRSKDFGRWFDFFEYYSVFNSSFLIRNSNSKWSFNPNFQTHIRTQTPTTWPVRIIKYSENEYNIRKMIFIYAQ